MKLASADASDPLDRRLAQRTFLFLLKRSDQVRGGRTFFTDIDHHAPQLLATCKMGVGLAMQRFLSSWGLETAWMSLYVWTRVKRRKPWLTIPSKPPVSADLRSTVVRDVGWLFDVTQQQVPIRKIALAANASEDTVKKGIQRARALLEMWPGAGRPKGRHTPRRSQ